MQLSFFILLPSSPVAALFISQFLSIPKFSAWASRLDMQSPLSASAAPLGQKNIFKPLKHAVEFSTSLHSKLQTSFCDYA
jgi:hypothetical protein